MKTKSSHLEKTLALLLAMHQHFRNGRYQLICTLLTRMFSSVHDIAFQAVEVKDVRKLVRLYIFEYS